MTADLKQETKDGEAGGQKFVFYALIMAVILVGGFVAFRFFTQAAKPVAIGTQTSDGDLAVVVRDFACGEEATGSIPNLASSRTKYCLAEVTVTNNGESEMLFSLRSQAMVSVDGARQSGDVVATALADPDNERGLDPSSKVRGWKLDANESRRFVLAFLEPKGFEPDLLEFHASSGSKGASVDVSSA